IPKSILETSKIIAELLNLDIDKTTRENIESLTKAFMDNVQVEDLPRELISKGEKATNDMLDAKERYDEAIESGDTKGAKQAEDDYKNAQQSLSLVNKEIEEIKKEASDLLKRAIRELYRDGKDQETEHNENYNQYLTDFQIGDEGDDDLLIVESNE